MSLKGAVERRHAMPDKETKENGPEPYFREAPPDINAKQKWRPLITSDTLQVAKH
jgi:hypothetical protein